MPKSMQHLTNFTPLNCVPRSVKTLLGTSNLYMILYRNLTAAYWVIFTTGMASIQLMNVSIPINKYLNPPGALEKMCMISILQTAKGQEMSIGQRGFACFVVYF
jgi:hypothetical protein